MAQTMMEAPVGMNAVRGFCAPVQGDANLFRGQRAFEGYHLMRDGNPGVPVTAALQEDLKQLQRTLDLGWIRPASDIYNISANLKDMVLLPAPAMYAHLPNKNGHVFSLAELLKFNTTAARVAYETWIGRPVLKEHNFTAFQDSKGVIVASVLRKVDGYAGKLHRLDFLKAFCRQKDPVLADQVLRGERPRISMGAICSHFQCTICGGIADRFECNHVTKGSPQIGAFEVPGLPYPKLAALSCINICGQESSSVDVPAYPYATGADPLTLS